MKRLFKFIGRVLKAAFKRVIQFVKDVVNNAAGIIILSGAAIGFTTLAIQLPFQIAMPLWIESTMIAPILGILTVCILIHIMKFQLSIQNT